MSLSRLYNKHGILVYRNAFVAMSLTRLPPIIATHTTVRKVFEQREAHLLHDYNFWYLEYYRREVGTFYKTVRFVNGPELERIEASFSGRSERIMIVTSVNIIVSFLGFFFGNASMFFAPLVLYPVYRLVFRKTIQEEKEMLAKVKCLQFFEDTLLELDYHKLLEEHE